MRWQSNLPLLSWRFSVESKKSSGDVDSGSILIARALQPVEIIIGTWKGFVDAKGQYSRIDQLLRKELSQKHQLELPAIVGESAPLVSQ